MVPIKVLAAAISQVLGSPLHPTHASISGGAWTPAQLFLASEQGAWYDPSDLSTLYQDSIGTTPVTAVDQPVGLILDKRLPTTSTVPLDAMAFSPNGSTPPTTADTTFLSEACGSVTFPANAGGYSVSRAASATTHPIVIGRRYTHSYRIALSRALTGGESIAIYTTGTFGSDNSLVLNSSTASGAWIDFADATVITAVGDNGENSCYVYAYTAIASPITVYIRQYTVRELPGNHASQSTAALRPVLSARKNLMTKTEDFSDPNWIKSEASVSMAGAVATITPSTTDTVHSVINNVGAVSGTQTISIEVKPAGYSKVAFKESLTTGQHASFDLTGAGSVLNMSVANATIALLPDGYYRLSMTVIIAGLVGRQLNILAPAYTSGDPNSSSFAGDGTSGVLVRYPQCEFGVSATTYQRVNTDTDYDTVGFPNYLKFDGVDDFLRTTFPNLGSSVTIGRSIPGTGASILTGQTIGAGNWDDSTSHCALIIIDRALTGPETTLVTDYLNARAGL